MNQSYVQTFKRHRLLFSLPVVIMAVLALWVVVGTPKEYKAGAALFVDNPVTQPSSFYNPNPSEPTPAAQAQQLLTELMATRSFRMKVGRKGPLTKYLATHPSEGWGPKGLLRKVRGTGSAEDRTWEALDEKHVITALPGGQIMSIELHGPTPEVAVGTLSALVATLGQERRAIDVARQQSAVTHFKNQMDTATRAINQIDARIASGTVSPAQAQVLDQSRKAAVTRLKRGTRGYNQAALSLAAAREAPSTYQVRDKPSLPAPAVSGMKKSVFGVVAGIFVGFLISFLAIVLLTGSDERREREELREVIARAEDDVPLDADQATGTNGSAVTQVPRVKANRER
jgi:uncharacterized protein involved in exopolysaccharide biosynthesis